MKFQLGPVYMRMELFLLSKNTLGISSRCSDGKHVLFIDVDGIRLHNLRQKLKRIVNKHHLLAGHIFRSRKSNYHVFTTDKMSMGNCIDILEDFDDKRTYPYRIYGVKRKKFILRIYPKDSQLPDRQLKYVGSVYGRNYELREQSEAHYTFLGNYYKIFPIMSEDQRRLLDGSKSIMFDNYPFITWGVKK